jgi:hypothetical protein
MYDFYNLISAKALFENGVTFYTRNIDYSLIMAGLFRLGGSTLLMARLPGILYTCISVVLVYILGKMLVSRTIGMIAAFLFAISPWSIVISLAIREYAFNAMLLLLMFIFIVWLHKRRGSAIDLSFMVHAGLASMVLLAYGLLAKNYGVYLLLITIWLWINALVLLELLDKTTSRPRKLFGIMFHGISIIILAGAHLANANYLSHHLLHNPIWFCFFFDATVAVPVHWFSGLLLSTCALIIALLFLCITTKNRYLLSLCILLVLNITFMVLRFNGAIAPRYMYHLLPMFSIIIAAALFYLYLYLAKVSKYSWGKGTGLWVIIVLLIINPVTIWHGFTLDTYTMDDLGGTSVYVYDNDYYALIDDMKTAGVRQNDPLVSEFITNVLTYYLDYSIDPRKPFVRGSGQIYDRGMNIYFENRFHKISEMQEALDNHERGWIFARTAYPPLYSLRFEDGRFSVMPMNLSNVTVHHVAAPRLEALGYMLYRWEHNG